MRGKRALLFVRQLGNRTATTVVVGFAIRLPHWHLRSLPSCQSHHCGSVAFSCLPYVFRNANFKTELALLIIVETLLHDSPLVFVN